MKKSPSTNESRQWHLIDASQGSLGRLATEIAQLLMGKQKLNYSPHLDIGDYVVVINADQAQFSGQKVDNKKYHHYSGYPGGLKVKKLSEKMKQSSTWVVQQAVRGMLPVNRLRKGRLARLKIYSDEKHPHQEQIKSK